MGNSKEKKQRLYSRATLLKELEKLQLIGHTDIARLFDWNTSKVATYVLRNTLPEPVTEISGRPVWYKPDILKAARQHGWEVFEDNKEWKDKEPAEVREQRRLERKKQKVGA